MILCSIKNKNSSPFLQSHVLIKSKGVYFKNVLACVVRRSSNYERSSSERNEPRGKDHTGRNLLNSQDFRNKMEVSHQSNRHIYAGIVLCCPRVCTSFSRTFLSKTYCRGLRNQLRNKLQRKLTPALHSLLQYKGTQRICFSTYPLTRKTIAEWEKHINR